MIAIQTIEKILVQVSSLVKKTDAHPIFKLSIQKMSYWLMMLEFGYVIYDPQKNVHLNLILTKITAGIVFNQFISWQDFIIVI